MTKKRRLTNLDVLPQQQAPQYKNRFDIEREDAAKRAEIERQRQAEERTARIPAIDQKVATYWGNPDARELMGKVGCRDDNSGLPLGEVSPNAGQEFLELAAANGVTLSTEAKQRLGTYIEGMHKHLGASVTPESMKVAFDRLRSLGCFADGEIIYAPQQEPEPAPEQQPDFDQLLATSDGSWESKRKIQRVLDSAVNEEWYSLFQSWHDSVYQHWNVLMTRKHHEKAWEFIRNHDQELNPMLPSTYDAARRELNRLGLLDCWTNKEWIEKRYARKELRDSEFKREMNLHTINGTLNDARVAV